MPLIFRTINENLYEYSFTKTVIYNSALLLINDLLIRFLAAGDHDQEGKIWISQFFMITFIFSYVSMLFKSSKNKDPKDEGSIDVLFCALFTGIIYFVFMTNI